MSPESKRTLIGRYLAAYNALDVDGMLAVLHPSVEFRNVSGGQADASASGAEALRRLAEQSRALFSSRRQEIVGFREDADTATIDVRWEGVPATDLPNGARAGQTLRIEGQSEFRFRDGLIDRITDRS